ncbi:DUF3221 domain-containing protein [Paenibacillus algorifonticola]|uniref:DUF3221 domain-containing protein n=1 Tax=Paenibacillus algorifonticola TaxID=684063 RepID=UPI003D2E2807
MKQIIIISLVLMTMVISGCTKSWDYRTGYIIDKKDQKVLVVRNITDQDVKNLNDQELKVNSIQEILKKSSPDAMWLTVQNEEQYNPLNITDKVDIVINGSLGDSYPMQAEAKEITKIK